MNSQSRRRYSDCCNLLETPFLSVQLVFFTESSNGKLCDRLILDPVTAIGIFFRTSQSFYNLFINPQLTILDTNCCNLSDALFVNLMTIVLLTRVTGSFADCPLSS